MAANKATGKAINMKIIRQKMPVIRIKNLKIAPIMREMILVIRLLKAVEMPGVLSTKAVFLYGEKKVLIRIGIEKK